MEKIDKVVKALTNLQPDANWSITGDDIATEEEFNNNIKLVVGEEPDGRSIMSEVNPYPSITWSTFSAEKDRIQAEYDGLAYARARKLAYPVTLEFIEAYTEKEIGGDSTKWDAYVIKYNKVRSDNSKPQIDATRTHNIRRTGLSGRKAVLGTFGKFPKDTNE